MKFIHVTDTHLVPPGRLLYGLDPRERLKACIADINRHHRDAALAIVTGDLAHWGEIDAYRALRDLLAELALPYHLLLGNHDHRGNFLQVFPSSPRDANGFVQFAFDTAAGRFICLDTNEPDVSWGVLCDKRLGWLKSELDRAGDRPVHLFMHHPPFPVGIKRMDAISLRDPDRMAEIVAGRRNIQHLYFGHLHRPIGGSWLGIPFTTMRATNHQVALDLVIEDVVPGSLEPPAYAVVFAQDGLTVVHFHDFLDTTATFNL
ncbi:MAG: phosphodiesterase [Proteobacteria bacterium]|nr:phosphodiesterase [Pseudomonadota bacterium]